MWLWSHYEYSVQWKVRKIVFCFYYFLVFLVPTISSFVIFLVFSVHPLWISTSRVKVSNLTNGQLLMDWREPVLYNGRIKSSARSFAVEQICQVPVNPGCILESNYSGILQALLPCHLRYLKVNCFFLFVCFCFSQKKIANINHLKKPLEKQLCYKFSFFFLMGYG